MKNKLITVGLSLLVVVTLGFAFYSWFAKSRSDQQKLAESVKQSEYAFEQYFGIEYSRAKEAALDHIRFLDQLSAESKRPTRNPYAVDAMCWYVRLALLEEKNNGSARDEYMQEACARCERLGKADCSKDKLRTEVARMDTAALAQLQKK